MKYFSMFSGIGGFELGIQHACNKQSTKIEQDGQRGDWSFNKMGHDVLPTSRTTPLCIGYSEIDKYAIKVYERQFNGHKNYGDATAINAAEIDKYAIKVYERNFSGHTNYGDATAINAAELPDFDLLVGGFPCQAFSVAGKRLGFNETRGTLFFDIARILKEKQPRHLVLENVKGLLSHDSGRTFTTIIGVLTDLGYSVEWQVLNSKNFGVPQNRERVYIIGHLGNGCGRQVFPLRQHGKAVNELPRHYANTLTARYEGAQAVGTYISESKLNAQNNTADGQNSRQEQTESNADQFDGGAQAAARIRRLTPKECERLQGFPDDWTAGESDTQRYKMCGNAVTVNTVQAVMEGLLNHG